MEEKDRGLPPFVGDTEKRSVISTKTKMEGGKLKEGASKDNSGTRKKTPSTLSGGEVISHGHDERCGRKGRPS